jgi:hypothetical protein
MGYRRMLQKPFLFHSEVSGLFEAVHIATRLRPDSAWLRVTKRFDLITRKTKKKHCSMPKYMGRTTVIPVRPCVTFHNLAKWAKQPCERLRIQSCHLEPREL